MIDVRLAGRYRLESEIGAGGMTGVWQAVDEVLERPVAVKILHRHLLSNQVFCDRFRKEALAAGALIHPNIVSVYDTGQHDEAPYVVMEYVAGGSLASRLGRGPLPPGPSPALPPRGPSRPRRRGGTGAVGESRGAFRRRSRAGACPPVGGAVPAAPGGRLPGPRPSAAREESFDAPRAGSADPRRRD